MNKPSPLILLCVKKAKSEGRNKTDQGRGPGDNRTLDGDGLELDDSTGGWGQFVDPAPPLLGQQTNPESPQGLAIGPKRPIPACYVSLNP